MAKCKWIPCDIFKRGVYVFVGTLKEFKSWIAASKEWSEDFKSMVANINANGNEAASYNYDFDASGVIFLRKFPRTPKEVATLSHEVLHATFKILDYCHVNYEVNENNETFTYLDEHIMHNALEFNDYKTL